MPVAERQQESEARGWLLRRPSRITGRIPGLGAGTRKRADVWQVSL